jgi:hypothetical protein
MVQASRWIYDQVPEGSRIGSLWPDQPLPLPLIGKPVNTVYFQFSRYDVVADATSKQVYYALREYLKNTDYLTVNGIATTRTIFAMPWRYPVQEQFYRSLMSEELGFKLISQFTSYPTFLGVRVIDDVPPFDPSFVEYDHPPVWVFRKERQLSDSEWEALFGDAMKKISYAQRHAP